MASGRHCVSVHCGRKSVLQKLTRTADTMQQITSDVNEMRRSLFVDSVTVV